MITFPLRGLLSHGGRGLVPLCPLLQGPAVSGWRPLCGAVIPVLGPLSPVPPWARSHLVSRLEEEVNISRPEGDPELSATPKEEMQVVKMHQA